MLGNSDLSSWDFFTRLVELHISFDPQSYQSTKNSKTALFGCEFNGSPSSAFIPTIMWVFPCKKDVIDNDALDSNRALELFQSLSQFKTNSKGIQLKGTTDPGKRSLSPSVLPSSALQRHFTAV